MVSSLPEPDPSTPTPPPDRTDKHAKHRSPSPILPTRVPSQPSSPALEKATAPSTPPAAALSAALSVDSSTVKLPHLTQPGLDPTVINLDIFAQILELDEGDDNHEFSRGMALAYFDQAEDTLKRMDEALESGDLMKLSSLGHYLKGSSATLGIGKLQSSCEKIQQYGLLRDGSASDMTKDDAVERIRSLVGQARRDYHDAKTELRRWYDGSPTLTEVSTIS